MEIKVYVANLAKYTEGKLVGEWLTLPMEEEELQEALGEILGDDEEYAIHDYEAPFPIGEYGSLTDLNEIAEELESIDENLFKAIINQTDYKPREVIDIISEGRYSAYYEMDDLEDLARELYEEGYFGVKCPDSLEQYLDFEKMGDDLSYRGWNYDDETGIVVSVD